MARGALHWLSELVRIWDKNAMIKRVERPLLKSETFEPGCKPYFAECFNRNCE